MPFTNRIIITDKNHRAMAVGKNAKVVFDSSSGKIVAVSETHCTLLIEGEEMRIPWKQISQIY